MTIVELKKLGWNKTDMWNNRQFYELDKDSKYSIFEHCGDYGLLDPYSDQFALIYCNMTDEEVKEFTELVKVNITITNNAKDHSLQEYIDSEKKIHTFISKIKDRN